MFPNSKNEQQLGWNTQQIPPPYPTQPYTTQGQVVPPVQYFQGPTNQFGGQSVQYVGQQPSPQYIGQGPPMQFVGAPYIATAGAIHNAPGFGPSNIPSVDAEGQKENAPEDFGDSFSTRAIRHRFVRKVYAILTCQLLVSFGIVCLFSLQEDVRLFVRQHSYIMWLAYGVFIVTYIMLICCSSLRRKWPGNFILLGIFTLAMSYLLGTISSFYKTEIVLMSVGATALICFLITLFAIQTKIDFTGCGVYLFVAGIVVVIFGLVTIFIQNRTMNLLYSALIVLLFSMYLIFDTQRLMGGRKHELSAEEHIYGALVLYIDVVNIFMGILGLSRGSG